MNLFSFFKKDQEPVEEAPRSDDSSAEAEAPEAEEEVTLGTKIKVVAALAVVAFATYVAYWVQEPADYKAQLITPDSATEAAEPADTTMVAQVDSPESEALEVSIVDFTFTPANLTVEEGTTVIWTNIDAVEHTVTGEDFTSELMNPGDSFTFTFDQEGTYEYFCTIHPQMRGRVTVTAAAAAIAETQPVTTAQPAQPAETSAEPVLLETVSLEPVAAPGSIVTLDAQALLAQPPAADETIILSLPGEAEPRAAALEAQDGQTLTKSGPEDVLYLVLFAGILFVNRRRLFVARR